MDFGSIVGANFSGFVADLLHIRSHIIKANVDGDHLREDWLALEGKFRGIAEGLSLALKMVGGMRGK